MEVDLKRLQQPTGGTGRFLQPKKINNGKETCYLLNYIAQFCNILLYYAFVCFCLFCGTVKAVG